MRVWKKLRSKGEPVFVHSAQTVTASRENALIYDGGASGSTIYTYVNGNPISFVDPLGLSKMDPLYGLGKKFWNWFHKQPEFNHLKGPDGLVHPDVAKQYHDEWKSLDKPDVRKDQRGSADPSLIEWLIPWPIIPSETGGCDANGNCSDMMPPPPKRTCP